MSWADDTNNILQDSGSVTLIVYSASFNHTAIPPTEIETLIESSTVYLFPRAGDLEKDERGQVIGALDLIIFPQTTSVAVTNRVYESGSVNYFEVKRVDNLHGHTEVHARKVDGR